MTSTDIYRVLSSVPHNSHYLLRYIKVVESLRQQTLEQNIYTETHHICPKAPDMFPHLGDLRYNSWNALKVTYRQHFLLHRLLWKCFGGSQTTAFLFMNNTNYEDRQYRKLTGQSYNKLKQDRLSALVGTSLTQIHRDRISQETRLHFANESIESKQSRAENIAKAKLGVSLTDEHKKKLSAAQTGLKRTPEHIAAIIKANTGKKRDSTYCESLSTRMKNTGCYKDHLGNSIRISSNDLRVLSGEYIGNASKPKNFSNINGETIYVLRNDPRVLSGEYSDLS